MPHAQPQQPAYVQPAAPQQIAHPQQFAAVQAQPPTLAYPQIRQAWAPQGFVQPAAYPFTYPPYFVSPGEAASPHYPASQPQPVFSPGSVFVAEMQHAHPRRGAANDRQPAGVPSSIEEIRDSLRDFRDAVRDLAESRSRRRAG